MEITITIKNDENEEVISKTKMAGEESEISISSYARFFDESNPNWDKRPEYNLMFIRAIQQWANDALVTNRKLYLNQVYEALGMDKTNAGQVVGWVVNNPDGDGYIDFGIHDLTPSKVKRIKSYETSILLDFNVDGVIMDK